MAHQVNIFSLVAGSDIGTSAAGIFDRYRPAAIRVLCDRQPFHVALGSEDFRELLAASIPEFSGDSTDAAAMLDEEDLRLAVERAEPVTAHGLDSEFPVLADIGRTLRLSFAEELILAFILQAQGEWFWEQWARLLGPRKRRDNAQALARVLGLETGAVMRSADPDSPLIESSLLERRFFCRVASPFAHFCPSTDLDVSMLRCSEAWGAFLEGQFTALRQPASRHDFAHLDEHVRLATDCLENALRANMKGIHVLLYGPPGTGKTTLARELIRRAGTDAFEIRKEAIEGCDSDGEMRLRKYNLCQRLGSSRKRHLVLFDELEDLLPANPFLRNGQRVRKGWICESLEQSNNPTIWTSNSLSGIDPAILRRFTVTLKVDVPPQGSRRKLLKRSLGQAAVSDVWLERTALLDCLTPALTAQLAQVVDALPHQDRELEANLDHWLNERLRAMGRPPLPPAGDHRPFHCGWLNTDSDPDRLIEGLKNSGEGRLCLYGPPGSGKTGFARHIAERLDRPALTHRGSDLRSMWVGETERNVADMFARAAREGAVLILDEADSFLGCRSTRHHQWEMNEVSEFLVQLEAFPGIFCATTNRFDALDPAFTRRFDLKIRFDFLTLDQRAMLLRQMLRDAGRPPRLDAKSRDRLARLDQLTPGDFVTAIRKLRISKTDVSETNMISVLINEMECKNVHRSRPIGFQW